MPAFIFSGSPPNAFAGLHQESTSGKLGQMTKIIAIDLSSTSRLGSRTQQLPEYVCAGAA
ncbi:hypothetical protein [Fundicoccus culcitae]|uniref:Uncharacterized protein n=1 Tax=Fundicoccus culcitae TaxID=2969821 RepID=A0ABY5P4T1_9LACT|nr:hypothetical protein [Fundicoccus culcitae]UUX33418.1 hypothetical protein NRE15_10970 [Fundicoccus culcitae]